MRGRFIMILQRKFIASNERLHMLDVKTMDEHLMDGLDIKEGTNIDIQVRVEDFFMKLMNDTRDGHIVKFKFNADFTVAEIHYLKEIDHTLDLSTLELDISDASPGFTVKLFESFKFYKAKKEKFANRTKKLLERHPESDLPIALCYRELKSNIDRPISKMEISKEKCEEIKSCLNCYSSLWECIFKRKASPLKWFINAVAFVALIMNLITVFPSSIVNGTIMTFFILLIDEEVCRVLSSNIQKRQLDNLNHLRDKYNYDLPTKESKIKPLGLVDFIEKDLMVYPDLDKTLLLDLARKYSQLKSKWYFDGDKEPDNYRYLVEMINIEMACLNPKKDNRLRNTAPVFTPRTLDERLRFLGIEESKIESDPFLKEVRSTMAQISILPYEGIEYDLLALIKLSLRYATLENVSENVTKKLATNLELIRDSSAYKRECARRNSVNNAPQDSKPKLESKEISRPITLGPIRHL